MTVLFGVLGIGCVVTVVVDLLWTTVAADAGGGPLTTRLTQALWRRAPKGQWILHVLGVVVTLTVILTWITLLLFGWYLLFSASPQAVVDATTREPADVWSRLYFTGFTIFTLGTGDYVPGAPLWQIATVASTASGLSLVTLAITYLLSVTESVTQRRRLAAQISALGRTPTDILRRAWRGAGFQGLEPRAAVVAPDVSELAQRHLAFPVLHYFHSRERETAIAPSIAVLDELLTVLEHRVGPEQRPPTLTTHQLRDAITQLLTRASAVGFARLGQSLHPPPSPRRDVLRRIGLPLADDAQWHPHTDELNARREALHDYVIMEGWSWDDVWPPGDT